MADNLAIPEKKASLELLVSLESPVSSDSLGSQVRLVCLALMELKEIAETRECQACPVAQDCLERTEPTVRKRLVKV